MCLTRAPKTPTGRRDDSGVHTGATAPRSSSPPRVKLKIAGTGLNEITSERSGLARGRRPKRDGATTQHRLGNFTVDTLRKLRIKFARATVIIMQAGSLRTVSRQRLRDDQSRPCELSRTVISCLSEISPRPTCRQPF
jgi:hypothetical protein